MSEDIKIAKDEDTLLPSEAESEISDIEVVPTEPEQVTLFDNETPIESDTADEDSGETDEHTPSTIPSPAEPEDDSAPKERTRLVDTVFDFFELFIFTLVAVLVVTSLFVRHSKVIGDSMEGTLHDGDTLLISNLFYTPSRGDIVVVSDYSSELKKPIVKRIIAIGGDTVRVTKHRIFVNGEALSEDAYVYTDTANYEYSIFPEPALYNNKEAKLHYEAGEYYEFTVPMGELFIMGDHRNNSQDSRSIGTVRADAVLGRVFLRILPFAKFGFVD